jgi:hypothetical protein
VPHASSGWLIGTASQVEIGPEDCSLVVYTRIGSPMLESAARCVHQLLDTRYMLGRFLPAIVAAVMMSVVSQTVFL